MKRSFARWYVAAIKSRTEKKINNQLEAEFQVISEKQMQDFMFLQNFSDRTFVLPHPENLRGGEKVRVVKGDFAGIEGELYRIRGHKRVVVKVGGLVSLAMEYVPKEWLERI